MVKYIVALMQSCSQGGPSPLVPRIVCSSKSEHHPRMSVALHPARASASGAARTRLAELFGKTPLLTLERSARHGAQPDDELWQQGPFSAEIIPDLPEISSWQEVTAKLTRRWDNLWPKLLCNRALGCGHHEHVLLQCCLQQLVHIFEQLVHIYDRSS